MLGVHALTGCDKTSVFCGKGKVNGLQLSLTDNSTAAATEILLNADVTDEMLALKRMIPYFKRNGRVRLCLYGHPSVCSVIELHHKTNSVPDCLTQGDCLPHQGMHDCLM